MELEPPISLTTQKVIQNGSKTLIRPETQKNTLLPTPKQELSEWDPDSTGNNPKETTARLKWRPVDGR